jgi:brefeldin A-resistance guanine nucleotide exchange factor 1
MLDQMADESVCELLEVGLGMLARARLGEGLRNAAQNCVQAIVRACFERLKSLTTEDVERLMSVKENGDVEGKVHVEPNGEKRDGGEGSGPGEDEEKTKSPLSAADNKGGLSVLSATEWIRQSYFFIP